MHINIAYQNQCVHFYMGTFGLCRAFTCGIVAYSILHIGAYESMQHHLFPSMPNSCQTREKYKDKLFFKRLLEKLGFQGF